MASRKVLLFFWNVGKNYFFYWSTLVQYLEHFHLHIYFKIILFHSQDHWHKLHINPSSDYPSCKIFHYDVRIYTYTHRYWQGEPSRARSLKLNVAWLVSYEPSRAQKHSPWDRLGSTHLTGSSWAWAWLKLIQPT